MQIGICTAFSNASGLKPSVDYIEENVQRLLVGQADDEEFAAASAGAADCGLPILAANCFLPGSLRSTGPDVDLKALKRYVSNVMARAATVGIRRIVFGSGGSRKLEEGMTAAGAMKDFIAVNKAIAPIAAAHGVTLVIEPLNSQDCNFITCLRDGAEVVTEVDHPNVRLLADLYHMARDDEDPEEIARFGNLIAHVHVAEKEHRTAPGVEGDDLRPYLTALKEAGYSGGLSLECRWGDDMTAEAPPAVASLRQQAAAVGLE